jgi:PIN like domain
LSAFEKLDNRAWIPHQVALEFHRNRPEVIFEYGSAYKTVLDAIATHETAIHQDLLEKTQQLAKRTALSEDQREDLLGKVSAVFVPLRTQLERLRDSHGIGQSLVDEPILQRLQEIFDGKTGRPLGRQEHVEALEEANRRIKQGKPPRYRDQRPGDYIVWRQTLEEVKSRGGVKVLVFVTEDVKEDWYLKVRGRVICARPELAEEAFQETGASLVMMRTETFLRHSASHLRAQVSEETIRQAEELPDVEAMARVETIARRAEELTSHEELLTTRLHATKDQLADVERRLSFLRASVNDGVVNDADITRSIAELAGLERLRQRLESESDHLTMDRAAIKQEQVSLLQELQRPKNRQGGRT